VSTNVGRAEGVAIGRAVRRIACGAAVAGLALGPVAPAMAGTETTRVKLPTETDAIAVAVNIERILNGARGVETRLPGPVTDTERVRVGFDLDGSPVEVVDEQRLELSGVGDFEFKIPGPASDVTALPGSESEPGLRRGSVLWQGFCAGTKALGARLDLIPGQEDVRLPVSVHLSMTVDGTPLEPGKTVSGELRLVLTVTNNSVVPIQVVDGAVDPARGAAVLDAIRAVLRSGRRPVPGSYGVPASVGLSQTAFRTAQLDAPARVRGSIQIPGRSVVDERVSPGVRVRGDTATFDAVVGGGGPLVRRISLTARVRDLRLPRISLSVVPTPPPAGTLAPPAGRTWNAAVRNDPGAMDAQRMVRLMFDTMWRVARLRQFDAYLGNPDPTGAAQTTYRYVLAPPPQGLVTGRPPAPSSGGPVGTAAAAAVLVLLLLGAVVAWSRS
jgi:hypothetical protein